MPIHKNVFRENLRKFEIIFGPPKFAILKNVLDKTPSFGI